MIIFRALGVVFIIAQGAVVFATAYFGLRLLKQTHWLAKMVAMVVSWAGWISFTVFAYAAAGGDGSFMKGFAVVIMLCLTATASAFIYLLGWLLWPLARAALRVSPSA